MICQQQKWTNAESRTAGHGGDGDFELQCIAVDRMKKHDNVIDVKQEKQTAGVIQRDRPGREGGSSCYLYWNVIFPARVSFA